MKNILIITYNFPPEGGPAVQRVSKFVKYLNQFDYKVIVLTSIHKNTIIDKTLLNDIPKNTIVYRQLDIGSYLPGEIRNKVLKKYFVPDKQVFWKFTAIRKIEEIIQEHSVEVILTTSPPHSVHLLGLEIKKRFDIPLITDFRDEWTKNPSFKDFHNKSKNRELEELVVNNADHIITCTQTAQENFRTLYSIEKVSLIRNGFDSEDFDFLKNKEFLKNNDINSLNILYYGRLSPLKTRLSNLLQVMSELKNEINTFTNNVQPKLNIIGNNIKEKWLKNYPNIDEQVNFIDYKPHRVCLEYARRTDVLLLLATNMQETEFFPAKVYEYIKSGKPILAVVTKKGELTSFLESYGNSYIAFEDDVHTLKKRLLELMKLKKHNKLRLSNNFEFINQYDRKNQTRELVKIIEKISK